MEDLEEPDRATPARLACPVLVLQKPEETVEGHVSQHYSTHPLGCRPGQSLPFAT